MPKYFSMLSLYFRHQALAHYSFFFQVSSTDAAVLMELSMEIPACIVLAT